MGYANVDIDLTGKQQGEFEIETKTGMLIHSKITARMEGHLLVLGRKIPVTIKNSIKMSGKREN